MNEQQNQDTTVQTLAAEAGKWFETSHRGGDSEDVRPLRVAWLAQRPAGLLRRGVCGDGTRSLYGWRGRAVGRRADPDRNPDPVRPVPGGP